MRSHGHSKPAGPLAGIVGAIGAIVWPSAAAADYPYPFVQTTCAPALHYAAVRRFIVMNPVGFDGREARSTYAQTVTEQHDHIFTSQGLVRSPAKCEIAPSSTGGKGPRSGFSLKASATVDPPAKGQDRVDQVTVSLDGKAVGTLWMGLKYEASGTDSVEVYADGVGLTVRVCAFDTGSDSKLTCTVQRLPPPR